VDAMYEMGRAAGAGDEYERIGCSSKSQAYFLNRAHAL